MAGVALLVLLEVAVVLTVLFGIAFGGKSDCGEPVTRAQHLEGQTELAVLAALAALPWLVTAGLRRQWRWAAIGLVIAVPVLMALNEGRDPNFWAGFCLF